MKIFNKTFHFLGTIRHTSVPVVDWNVWSNW